MERSELGDGWITLRPPTPADADAVAEAVRESLPELKPWLPWATDDYSPEHARAWISKPTDAQGDRVMPFLIVRDGALLGSCGMHIRSETLGEIGYWMRTSATGQGIATAAARLLARFGFESLGLTRIFIRADPDNIASQRVAIKTGGSPQHPPLLPSSSHTHPDGSVHELVEFVIARA